MNIKWNDSKWPVEINGYTNSEWADKGKKLNSEYTKHLKNAQEGRQFFPGLITGNINFHIFFNRYENDMLKVIKGQNVPGFKKEFVSFAEWFTGKEIK